MNKGIVLMHQRKKQCLLLNNGLHIVNNSRVWMKNDRIVVNLIQSSLLTFWNTTEKEFPCLRSNVSDALDVKQNRHVYLTQKLAMELKIVTMPMTKWIHWINRGRNVGVSLLNVLIVIYSIRLRVKKPLTNVHKYFAPIDVIGFQIVQNLTMLFALKMFVVYQVDVAIINVTVYTVKMNTGVY